ncbi:hypothetical protein ACFL3E_02140 [Patescibacteria group bacterium]
MNTQKGALGIIVGIIVAVLILGGGGYYIFNNYQNIDGGCTEELKICPDGSTVGRVGLNCEFEECPEVADEIIDETSNWQTYKNEEYGFEIKYPQDWLVVNELDNGANFADSNEINYRKIAVWVYEENPEQSIMATDGIFKYADTEFQGLSARRLEGESGSTGRDVTVLIFESGNNFYVIHSPPDLFDEVVATFSFIKIGISVDMPQQDSLVKLPIIVKGTINGNGWFANEGETGFVQVYDANNKSISNSEILKATTDWLQLPTSFEAMVGDREMMSYIETDTGYLKFTNKRERDSDVVKEFIVSVKFESN